MPAAGRTGALDEEEALLRAHLAGTTAGGAGVAFSLLLFGAGSGAGLARHAGRHPQVDLGAGEGIGEVDFDLRPQVGACAGATAARLAAGRP